ncbi:MAG: phosphate ABC transporter substrate-binding protein [Bacillota bacterium]
MSAPHGRKGGRLALAAAIGLALVILLSGCRSGSQETSSITLAGSTSVQPFAEKLAEEYQNEYPDRPSINVQGGGSSAGAAAVLSGAAQIGMMSRGLGEGEDDLTPIVIARDAIAVIVNPGNPITSIDLKQLQDVFSGEITDWSELGGPDGQISVISREEGSGTRGAFEELVMKETDIAKTVVVQDSNGAVRETIARDQNAIGYVSLGMVDSSVKPLAIGDVTPSVANVKNGSYTLVRPFLFVVKGDLPAEVVQFIDYVTGEDGQRILAGEGLIVGE